MAGFFKRAGNVAGRAVKDGNPLPAAKGILTRAGNLVTGGASRIGSSFKWAATNKYVMGFAIIAAVTAAVGAIRYAIKGRKDRLEAKEVAVETKSAKLDAEMLEMEAMNQYLENYGKNLQQHQQRMNGQTGGRTMTAEEYARLQAQSGYGPRPDMAENHWRNTQRPNGQAQSKQQMLEMQLQENGAYGYRK